jgi:hypothetical protein
MLGIIITSSKTKISSKLGETLDEGLTDGDIEELGEYEELGERLAEGLNDGEAEEDELKDGDRDVEGLRDGETEAEGLRDGDAEELGETEAEGLRDGETEELGDREAEGLRDGDAEELGETEAEGLRDGETEELGDREAEGLRDGETEELGETEAEGLRDGETEADGLTEGETEEDGITTSKFCVAVQLPHVLLPSGSLALALHVYVPSGNSSEFCTVKLTWSADGNSLTNGSKLKSRIVMVVSGTVDGSTEPLTSESNTQKLKKTCSPAGVGILEVKMVRLIIVPDVPVPI